MKSGKYLLDTNIVIAFLNGDKNIEARLSSALRHKTCLKEERSSNS